MMRLLMRCALGCVAYRVALKIIEENRASPLLPAPSRNNRPAARQRKPRAARR